MSELTSANLFAVFGNEVLTPPLSSGCLPGVTRALLLEEVKVPGIVIRESKLMPEDLERADGLFITSSTRDLLRVKEIQSLKIQQSDEVRGRLNLAFSDCLDRFCEAKASIRA